MNVSKCSHCEENYVEFGIHICETCQKDIYADDAIRAAQNAKPKRHTYITTLQEQVNERDMRIVELEEQIHSVVRYLSLPKFKEETWVSKYDILRMLGKY